MPPGDTSMPEKTFNYREQIVHTACLLCTFYSELYFYGINTSLCDELKDLKSVFKEGDDFPFDMALLESLDDENVKTMMMAMRIVESAVDSIQNLNNISDEELRQALEDGHGSEFVSGIADAECSDYQHLIDDLMGYTHYIVFNILCCCYSLSHGVVLVDDDTESELYFPTNESLMLLDNTDANVSMLSEMAFELSSYANKFCESDVRRAE